MSKKTRKVEETKSSYPAKPASAGGAGATRSDSGVRYADVKKVRATNARLVTVHRDVLEKLAR